MVGMWGVGMLGGAQGAPNLRVGDDTEGKALVLHTVKPALFQAPTRSEP